MKDNKSFAHDITKSHVFTIHLEIPCVSCAHLSCLIVLQHVVIQLVLKLFYTRRFQIKKIYGDLVTPCAYTVFLGSGSDVVSYFLGGEFDVVHEGLLGLITAYVHHLDDIVFVT